jgi:2-oxoglutarate dehydrogenase complex dehydrogenase (E1) component-like enzyme
MPRRSIIYTDHSPPRIDPPTFPPRTVPHNPNNDPQSTEHSTYSEIIATCTVTDLLAEDSVEKYDDCLNRLKSKKARIPDDILSVTPSTASLIKKHNKKAKKAGKVDNFKLFQEGRDGMSHLPSLRGNSGADDRTATTILSTSHPTCRYSIVDET